MFTAGAPCRRAGSRRRLLVGSAALAAMLLLVPTPTAASAHPRKPRITSIATSAGGVGTRVTIHGRNLGRIRKVTFGSSRGTHLHRGSSRTLTVLAPRHSPGTVQVLVWVKQGLLTAIVNGPIMRYTYYGPPALSGVSANAARLGGGSTVTVRGSGFRSVSRVTFGGVPGTRVHVLSPYRLTAVVPRHYAATVDVRVAGRYGTSRPSSRDRFTYVAAPTVTGVAVTSGADIGGRMVTLTGTALVRVTKVSFGAVPGSAIHLQSATRLTVRTPAHAAGVVDIQVTTPYGTSALGVRERYTFTPTSRVLAWGDDTAGELGDDRLTNRLTPTEIVGLDGPVAVTADSYGGTELMPDGTVRTWGIGTPNYQSVPATVPGLTGVVQLESNAGAHLALRADGTVWSWGINADGALGDGTVATDGCLCRDEPEVIPGLTGVVRLATGPGGFGSMFAVKADGTVWGWGRDDDGSLGLGVLSPTPRSIPVPTELPGLSGISAVASGGDASYAVGTDGTVWVWGCCGSRLGNGHHTGAAAAPVQVPGLTDIASVSPAESGVFAFSRDGTIYAWGDDGLGLPGDAPDGHLRPVAVPQLAGFTSITGGNRDYFGIKADGTVWAWGFNSYGELGTGAVNTTTTPITTPTQLTGLRGVTSVSTTGIWTFAYEPPR